MTGDAGQAVDGVESWDIARAIADALSDHENWLDGWRRALICGLPPPDLVVSENSQSLCRFGRWFERYSQSGVLDGDLFIELGRNHREVHEAARYLAAKAAAGQKIPADEYDAAIGAFESFRNIAARIQEEHGIPDSGADALDPELAELQSRMTMLSELEREWERATRTGMPMCLALVRPNEIGAIEEKYGSLGIDRVVAGLAARIYMHLRPYDAVYRYGRSEFLLCLPGADARQADGICHRLCESLDEAPFALSRAVEVNVSARFGVAVADSRSTVQEILDRASRAANMAGTAEGERVVAWAAELEN